jgi:hypothetical protein
VNGLEQVAGLAPSRLHVKDGDPLLAWNAMDALVELVSEGGGVSITTAGVTEKVYVWASKDCPAALIGVTVIVPPFTVTLRKL